MADREIPTNLVNRICGLLSYLDLYYLYFKSGEYLTKEEIRKIGKHKRVQFWQYRVSELPILSFDYEYCRAIALSDETKVGLSHIDSTENPEIYLEKMKKKLGDNGLKAIVIEANMTYDFPLDEGYFKSRGIELVDIYRQGQNGSCPNVRDILATSKQVTVYTAEEQKVLEFEKKQGKTRLSGK